MLKPDGPDRFRIDFSQVRRDAGWKRILSRGPVVVDAFAIGKAVIAALQACPFRSATGAPQVWNEYRVFLARQDHDRLRPIESTLYRDLMPALYDELVRLNAVPIGALTIRLLVDDAEDVQPGTAILHVRHTPDAEAPTAAKGEITVRLDRPAPPPPAAREDRPPPGLPTLVPASVPPNFEATTRVELGSIILEGHGYTIPLQDGARYVVGRAHPDAPESHIALPNAGARINRRQFGLMLTGDSVEINREPGKSNPVQVAAQPLAPGEVVVTRLPVDVILSGELRLLIKRTGGPDVMSLTPC